MKILKFGGTSIATPERLTAVLNLINEAENDGQIAVVVSAFGGVTDQLIRMIEQAGGGEDGYSLEFSAFVNRHELMIQSLTTGPRQEILRQSIKRYTSRLSEILRGVYLVRHVAPKTYNQILSYGERLSARIITACLQERGGEAEFIDARHFVRTDDNYAAGVVDFELTTSNIQEYFQQHKCTQIITGFIAANTQHETTTLGRSGSDYTAAIFGRAVAATEIEIWTDVDGILTANPREVQEAHSIPLMTYEDAMEMSHFGAKVIFPPTIQPAMQAGIPIRIKNTFNPDFPGTLIGKEGQDMKSRITGITSMDSISLIRIQGSGMIGKTGLTGRIFMAMANSDVGVMLISLASSEHSICFAVDPHSAETAKAALEKEFQLEIQVHGIAKILIEENLCIVAVVGENMRHTPGISGKVFNALGDLGVNVVAIAQGSSERNISIVISRDDEVRVKRELHKRFFNDIQD
ncbi:MAG: aspartate kinase [Candidatus Marinimicrobia bacterium]|nr:aspartate kinase [Candidatus Neomarinimicrobiota bacterium]